MIAYAEQLLKDVGPYVDVIITGDDLGMTAGPMMSPASYRRFIKPHHAELFSAIKRAFPARYSSIPAGMSISCWAILPTWAWTSEPGAGLGRRNGRHGPAEVGIRRSAFVLRRHRHAEGAAPRHARGRAGRSAPPHPRPAGGGGYIVAAVHCIQPDVPPENIVAMCDEVCMRDNTPDTMKKKKSGKEGIEAVLLSIFRR